MPLRFKVGKAGEKERFQVGVSIHEQTMNNTGRAEE
jgi:hypothetical protein